MNIRPRLIIPFLFFSFLHAQNPGWITYTSGNYIGALALEGNYIWAGTSAGLIKIDKNTHEEILYNHTNSGLPNNDIYSLAIDGAGNKWLGTAGGMAKFDGANWTVYDSSNSNMPHGAVYALIIDPVGVKWIGTNGDDLVKYDGIQWTVYNTSNSGLPDDVIFSLAIDSSGNTWVGTAGGMAKFDGKNWTGYPPLARDGETALLAGDSGILWIGTGGGGLVKFDGTHWTVFSLLNSGLSNDQVKTLATDSVGNTWMGTWGGSLVKFDGSHWTVFTTLNSGLPYDYIDALAVDSSGNKWVGTYGGGLALFNEGEVGSIKENKNTNEIPNEYLLSQNYPNPFNPETIIGYQLPVSDNVTLMVFDILGREVATLADGAKDAGYHSAIFDGRNFPSGIYIVRMTVSGKFGEKFYVKSMKMQLIR